MVNLPALVHIRTRKETPLIALKKHLCSIKSSDDLFHFSICTVYAFPILVPFSHLFSCPIACCCLFLSPYPFYFLSLSFSPSLSLSFSLSVLFSNGVYHLL